jgi:hypothetical protein
MEESHMRYILHTLFVAAIAVALAATPSEASAKRHQKKGGKAASPHSMTGCLARGSEANTYVLNNTESKGPKTAEIISSKVDLAPHVGHKVTLTGTTVSTKAAAKAEVKAEGKKATKGDVKKEMKEEAGEHHMSVTALTMVSASCS